MRESLKNTLDAAENQIQYDTAAKVLLSHKNILSHILAATVDEFVGMDPKEIEHFIEGDVHIGDVPVDPSLTNTKLSAGGDRVVGLSSVQPELNEGYVTFDIIFYVRMKDGLSQIIINVEAQKDDPSGYDILNRAIFYVSRLISSQKERDFRGKHYNDLKRVYSIWICMNMSECVWDYIHLSNENILGSHKWKGKLDLINIVLLGLPNELPPSDDSQSASMYELHRMLTALFSVKLSVNERLDILENEYGIIAETKFRKELDTMCNLSQGILEIGYDMGIEQGIELGKEQAAMSLALALNKKGMSADEIAKLMERTVGQIEEWLESSEE